MMGRPEPGYFVDSSHKRQVSGRQTDGTILAWKGARKGSRFGLRFAASALYLIIPVRVSAK